MTQEKLNPIFSYKNGEKDEEIFMSFALLNLLSSIVGDPQNVTVVSVQPEFREALLNAVLCKRTKGGKVEEVRTIDDVEIDPEVMEDMFDWLMDHVTAFTLRSLEKTMERANKNKERFQALKDSSSGLKS